MKLNRRLDRLESEVQTEGAGLTEHNLTFHDLRRVSGKTPQLVAWLVGHWREVKDDPLRELPAVWFAHAVRQMLWVDFHEKAPVVQQWLYNGGNPRCSTERLMGFDKLMVGRGWPGLYDFGNASVFRFQAPEAIEDPHAQRFAEEHAFEPADKNRYYR